MEGIPALRDLIQPGDWMAKIDLKDAYTVVPMHPESRQYLSFHYQGKIYRYTSLPFGLSVAPRIFSKLMRYAIEPLRKKGIRLVYYLDDICVLARSPSQLTTITTTITNHLTNLGFLINWKKTQLQPTQQQEFLGFRFDTSSMLIQVPHSKLTKLDLRIRQTTKIQSCRWIAALLGKITAMIPAIGNALLHIRYLQRDLSHALHHHRYQWDKPCPLSPAAYQDLQWWINNRSTLHLGLPIHRPPPATPTAAIYVDASLTGWGIKSPIMETAGYWKKEEQTLSINFRELKTILFALTLHANDYAHATIDLYTDSITALKYVTKQGGTSSPHLQQLALQIKDQIIASNMTVLFHHIPGILNVDADRLSRHKPTHEWTLPKIWLKRIARHWHFRPTIDAFASRTNHRLPTFWSYRPDPQASATNAFLQPWPKTGLYLHPPWALIPKVIQHLRTHRVKKAILITPCWPTQFWWPQVMMQTLTPPLHLSISKNKTFTAWMLSGTITPR